MIWSFSASQSMRLLLVHPRLHIGWLTFRIRAPSARGAVLFCPSVLLFVSCTQDCQRLGVCPLFSTPRTISGHLQP